MSGFLSTVDAKNCFAPVVYKVYSIVWSSGDSVQSLSNLILCLGSTSCVSDDQQQPAMLILTGH